MIGWAFFRAESIGAGAGVAAGLFGLARHGRASGFLASPAFFAALIIGIALIIRGENVYDKKWSFSPALVAALLALFVVCAVLVMGRVSSPFLYAQF